ncbi:hypothetical protein HPP92_003863 [Vanilla planifolia]|uniref:Uncharacterized protein n=1 Tax=Vanilla planifolia TaxID=51239 RepID=A0A835SCQ2_VANPL|nr:hypothetical protein HPP92_003863 [Vanilla planifolia]
MLDIILIASNNTCRVLGRSCKVRTMMRDVGVKAPGCVLGLIWERLEHVLGGDQSGISPGGLDLYPVRAYGKKIVHPLASPGLSPASSPPSDNDSRLQNGTASSIAERGGRRCRCQVHQLHAGEASDKCQREAEDHQRRRPPGKPLTTLGFDSHRPPQGHLVVQGGGGEYGDNRNGNRWRVGSATAAALPVRWEARNVNPAVADEGTIHCSGVEGIGRSSWVAQRMTGGARTTGGAALPE